MAKQSGIHQINGRVGNMSYYHQKGVRDGLLRRVNEGMSKRVKDDEAFANTRLNAAEFGASGSFSGAAIRAISDRQRTMLKDFATGDFCKYIKNLLLNDTTNPWGSRQLVGVNWQVPALAKISQYAKNDFQSYVGGEWNVSVGVSASNATWTPKTSLSEGWGSLLANRGATGAYINLYAYKIDLDVPTQGKMKGVASIAAVGSTEATIGTSASITEAVTLSAEYDGKQAANTMQGVLVVVRPYQEVNGEKYIRQELCTFQVLPVTTA